jgi:hypothetical protein
MMTFPAFIWLSCSVTADIYYSNMIHKNQVIYLAYCVFLLKEAFSI